MNNKQLAARIGNIDDQLVQQAEHIPNYSRIRRRRTVRHALASAAVLVLMMSSFAAGALACSRETIVEVRIPVQQETLELSGIGITLILPDSWHGRYALEVDEFGNYVVYSPSIREACDREAGFETNLGMLFYILKWDQQLTEQQHREVEGQWNFARNRYIMSTKCGTYLLYYASDVQFTVDTLDEYRQMEEEISDIRFILDDVLK